MSNVKKTLLVLFVVMTSGCASMNFTQKVERPKKAEPIQHWHHTVLNGIVEVSEPANLYKDCQGKPWQSAEVEFRFKNGLVGLLANGIIEGILFSNSLLAFYTPWSVEVECSQ